MYTGYKIDKIALPIGNAYYLTITQMGAQNLILHRQRCFICSQEQTQA